MKKRYIVLIVCSTVALVLAAVAGCTLQWFYSPGVHTLFGYVHIDTSVDGYLFSEETDEVLGPVTLSIETIARPIESDAQIRGADIQFGDVYSLDSKDPYYVTSVTSHKLEIYHLIRIAPNGMGTCVDLDTLEYDKSGIPPYSWLCLDEAGNILTFVVLGEPKENPDHPNASNSNPCYSLVFTDDAAEAAAYLDAFYQRDNT